MRPRDSPVLESPVCGHGGIESSDDRPARQNHLVDTNRIGTARSERELNAAHLQQGAHLPETHDGGPWLLDVSSDDRLVVVVVGTHVAFINGDRQLIVTARRGLIDIVTMTTPPSSTSPDPGSPAASRRANAISASSTAARHDVEIQTD